MKSLNTFLLIILVASILTNSAFAQEQIGVASAVNKNTTDLTLEQERKLIDAGYEIIQNHTIETDGIGRAQMLLLDGTAFSVGPNSSVVLDKFIYNPETAEGSLEVTARGLLRIVGGKVTKKQPALIRTNSATVGIRGGIGIVQTNGSQTNATFLYGTEMTVTPNCVDLDTFGDQCSPDFATTVTEPGFSVSVEDEESEPSEPVEVTEESLEALQEELEAPEEAPEEESTAEETATEEETSEEESVAEETPAEETQEEETATEETSSDESAAEETTSEESTTETESEAPAEIETETEVASDDAGDSTDIEVDEGLLDSSGVSDSSSDVAPEELGTAEEFEVAIELETVEADDANEDPTGDVAEEVAETTQETSVEVAPIFQVDAGESIESISENVVNETLTPLVFINPGELSYSVTISGDDAELVEFDAETQSINLISALDYETQTKLSFTVTIESENADISEIEVLLDVSNIDEPIELTSNLLADSFAENIDLQSAILESTALDPEGGTITFTLSGEGSENFSVDANGNISLQTELDYETTTSYALTLTASDGVNDTLFEISFSVIDIDEPAILTASTSATSFAEDSLTGINIGIASATDPEGQTVTFSLSGTGSENFSVDSAGNISLVNALDYETATSYTLALNASDGVNTTSSELIITVDDVNEAPSLSNSLAASSFAENVSTGTTIASASASDPESQAITYSLSGTGSGNFAVDSAGNITLAAGLDYETATSFSLTLSASDGVNTTNNTLTITVDDVNEAPSLSNSLAASSFAENIATGTTIATASASDPEAQSITYSLSGAGSDKFDVDSAGNITLSSALDYETTASYSLTLTASDGANSTSNTINISVDDVVELSIALASSSISLNETATSGTSVTTTSTTTDGSATVSYSLSGTGSDKFSVSSNGTITTAASLDYETTTSYSLTLTATDGTNTVTDSLTINITDVDLSLSASLASAAQSEGLSTGTTIATSSNSNAEGTVTYSLTDADNKFSIDSSTGEVTLANALDYETKTSHEFTITATDGVTTTSETFTLSVSDLKINSLAVTLANSGAALAESSSSGTAVGSSSITNPESETVSYALSGTGSSNFAVDSSGNVTTNATLDFETAKSYALTLTATAGGNTTTDTFTVNVGNVEELRSGVLRYSAAYNSASRSGFSATATRGPSGSSLPAYTLEQVGTTNTTLIYNVDDTTNNYVPVEINSGTALNWRYYFPITTSGDGQLAFAPNNASVDGKYYSPLGTAVTTTISNSEIITAGRKNNASFWFMTTDKAASNISFDSAVAGGKALILWNYSEGGNGYDGDWSNDSNQWVDAITAAGKTYDAVSSTSVPADLSPYSLIIDIRINTTSTDISGYESFLETSGNVLYVAYSEQCCQYQTNESRLNAILSAIGGGTATFSSREGLSDTEPIDSTYTGSGGIAEALNGFSIVCEGCGRYLNSAGNGIKLAKYFGYWGPNETDSDTNGVLLGVNDINWDHQTRYQGTNSYSIMQWIVGLSGDGSTTSSTYNLYEDQVTIAGVIQKDANFAAINSSKKVYAFAVNPRENFAPTGTANDYFYPNFINRSAWSYGDVGLDYCAAIETNSSSDCQTYANNYDWHQNSHYTGYIMSDRFDNSYQRLPEGMSLWWQVLNPSGVGVGLWAQMSIKDSYNGATQSTTRDDQQSLLNVVISNIDYRKNDTTRYSAGDTGHGMDGYHYWSFQGATNADNNGLGLVYGTSPIECATSHDSGCFFGLETSKPEGLMLTSSDPYKSGSMTLGVNYDSNNDSFSTGSFNQAITWQNVSDNNTYEQSQT
ncbi:cadherin domain-containing protein, partial [Pseudomonadota bacterium]|nr:cadherin domain-containing protein [Pseudomonadota bacterium]